MGAGQTASRLSPNLKPRTHNS